MEERGRFVVKATREAVGVAELCHQFGIRRKTGYKWLARYQAHGLAGLREGSRRPHRTPTHLPAEGVELVLRERHRHTSWGPKKLRALLVTKYGIPPVPRPPAPSGGCSSATA